MKFFLITFIALSFSALGLAAETSTECEMMRESNDRTNPKTNLATLKPRPKTKSSASAQ
jgi:hypothetical protein